MFKHFIWDFDGTLFDSYPPMVKAYRKALNEFGIDMSEEEILLHMKTSIRYLNELCEKRYGLRDDFRERFGVLRELSENELFEPYETVIPVLKTICERGDKNYVYTHRGSSTLRYLERYGMHQYFDEVVTFDNGFALKPNPEGIQFILHKYGIDPATAVMIGDRELDIISGQNAGIKGCFYSERPEYICDAADYTIRHHQELLGL